MLAQAVGRPTHLGRAGVYLSGGLDSGAVATLAAEHTRARRTQPPQALSLLFADPEMNEASIQHGLAENLEMPQTCLPLPGASARGAVEVLLASLNLNCTWPHPLAGSFLSVYLELGKRAKAQGCAYVLTGDGGDEWLDVHAPLAADYLRAGDFGALSRLCAGDRLSGSSWRETARGVVWENGVYPLVRAAVTSALGNPAALYRRRQRRFGRSLPPWLAPDSELRGALVARFEREAATATGSFYEGDVLRLLDSPLVAFQMEESFEAARRAQLPILSPFFDPDLVNFLVRVPPHLRSLGGRSKVPLRRLLHRRFPALGYDRQEKPFATDFFSALLLGRDKQLWPLLRQGALAECGVVDANILDNFISGALAGNRSSDVEPLWAVFCSEVWVRSRHRRVGQSLGEEVKI